MHREFTSDIAPFTLALDPMRVLDRPLNTSVPLVDHSQELPVFLLRNVLAGAS